MKKFKSLLVAFAILLCTASAITVGAQEALEPEFAAGSDGHGHFHGSIFHCSGTPIDCHNP